MIKKWAWIFAVVFIVAGVLGWVPGITTGGNLLGIFAVDTLHNLVHLITGLVFLWAALASEATGRTVFKVFGIIYVIVAIVGLFQGDTVLGLFVANTADHILHVVAAGIALYIGFGAKGGHAAAMPETPPSNLPSV